MHKSFRLMFAAMTVAAVGAIPAANADVVVIVSAKSTASTMTAQQISEVYLGKSNKMKPVDSREAPVRKQFYAKVAGKDEAQVKAIWSKLVFTGKATPPKELPTSEDVLREVAADPESLGYIERSDLDSSVKVVYEIK